MQLKDVMTPGVEVIAPEASIYEAAEKMSHRDIGPLPVCDGDRLIGMLTDRDITVRAVAAGRDPLTTQVREVMTPDVVYGFDDQDVQDAARLMEQYQIRRLPVLNRNKQLVGMVALGDLAVHPGTQPVTAAQTPPRPPLHQCIIKPTGFSHGKTVYGIPQFFPSVRQIYYIR